MTAYVFGLTVVHVVISLVAIAAGFVVTWQLWHRRALPFWNVLFLSTTIATSATGFLFPVDRVLPSHVLAVISLLVLAVSTYAWQVRRLTGNWRPVYAATAVAAFYLNFFVLIVQVFLKVPALHNLAPTQSEFPFAIAQGLTLVGFLMAGMVVTLRMRQVQHADKALAANH